MLFECSAFFVTKTKIKKLKIFLTVSYNVIVTKIPLTSRKLETRTPSPIQQNKQILDELETRKNEMLNLEKAITELHALFVEMANLVDEQGEMVNRILDNVTNTEAYVEKAVEDVHQAARYQSGARRKKLWLVILCLIVLAVIALIIFLSIPK